MVEAGEREPAILFNLAWSRAMLKDFEGALALLADHVATSLPQAAMLHVQILHELGRFDEAGDRARLYVGLFADYEPLMAAVSVLALDLDDEALAAACAARAPDHPDSLTTMGTLTLGEDRPEEALALFETALARNPNVPRAWVGRGLAKLLAGGADSAAEDIDRGAEMFGDHLGSWIAAGWAWFVRKDNAASRARFEKALSIDDTFAEAHGSLAVLDLLDGDVESARRRSEIALRLDRQCYSAALARTLIEAGSGDPEKAQRIYERAINTPVGESGRTIAQAMARLGTRLG
jgi:tetratricopeptide (TPR) repeat protein